MTAHSGANSVEVDVRAELSAATTKAPLVGRETELQLVELKLDALLERGAALVLRGEAGIGKSVLLDAARDLAVERGVRALHTAGVAAESDLPYSGLHRLLRPVIAGADELPGARRSALLGAFGIGDGLGGDPFLVALATLDLLSAHAAGEPLLVIADDLHWLDA
ncbi:MAG: ATP-binding protein, partial [Solirubrobacterales bacterium]|nr:ATP-binding protein [Solirubrobacterales bacterium]